MKDYFGYKDKICVITGASSGIGKATAKILYELGAKLYLLDRNKIQIDNTTFIECDLNDKESIDNAFKEIPDHIDSFFGIAGLSGALTNYYTTFTVNYIANKYIAEKYLKKRMSKNGSICFVTSTGGNHWDKYYKEYDKFNKVTSWEDMINILHTYAKEDTLGVMAYALSKRALNYYTCQLAIELGKKGIRVNALLPGSTDTGMKKEFEVEAGGEEKLLSHTGVANRLADPSEMAEPLVYLNSDMATFISGTHLIVDYCGTSMNTLGITKDDMDRKVASKLFNTKMVQNILKKQLEPLNKEIKEEKEEITEDTETKLIKVIEPNDDSLKELDEELDNSKEYKKIDKDEIL